MTKPSPPALPTPKVDADVTAPRLIEIFRAGSHIASDGRAVEFTVEQLQQIADGYDTALSPAPVVVGHPKLDAPAYGWVDRLVVEGNALFAEEGQVDPAFADLRKAGRFKNRSASFYLPDSPSNPKPGQLYIKHVGWLGAAAPAVKGLKQVSFAEGDEGVVEFSMNDRRWGFRVASDMFRRFRDWMIDTAGLEKANEILPDWQINSLNEAGQPDAESGSLAYSEHQEKPTVSDRTAEFTERETALNEREQRIAAAETAQATAAAAARRTEVIAFADGLVKAGKLLPASKPTVVELILALPTDAPLSFGEGDGKVEKPAAELFREFLDGLPKQIDFSEKSRAIEGNGASVDFAAPAGSVVNADQLSLHGKAKAYQAQHPDVTFLAAVKAVGG